MKRKTRKKEQTGKAGKTGNFRWYSTLGILFLWLCFAGNATAQQLAHNGQVCLVCNGSMQWMDVHSSTSIPPVGSSVGQLIFVYDTQRILEWNGTNWHGVWYKEYPKDVVVIPPPPGEDGTVTWTDPETGQETTCTPPPIRFMAYNLGADPTLNTPKSQIEYLSKKHPYDKEDASRYYDADERDLDARVSGGLYQWGRRDVTHGGTTENRVGSTPPYTRYRGKGANDNRYGDNRSGTVSNSQVSSPVDGVFYYGYSDWYSGTDGSNFWGNGSSDGWGQKTVKTDKDPCPPGFRVPTQNEWEQLFAYDCNESKTSAVAPNVSTEANSFTTNRGLTWVRVLCNGEGLGTAWTGNAFSGYAIYTTEAWDNAQEKYKKGVSPLYEDAAPEPLLFLPGAGLREYDNGYGYSNIHSLGTWGSGYYWSSSANKHKTSFLHITAGEVVTNGDQWGTDKRARGMSIRCVME